MEDLQKMMAVALVYRVLVCVYEVSHFVGDLDVIWIMFAIMYCLMVCVYFVLNSLSPLLLKW